VLPGQEISYKVVVSNLCSAPATAQVRDAIDRKLDSVRWCRDEGGEACTPGGQPQRDIEEIITLPAGGKATYRVAARIAATATGELANRACVSTSSASERCTPAIRNPIGVDLRLKLEAVVPPVSIARGQCVTFRWKVDNVRNTQATQVRLTILPPPDLVPGSATPPFDLAGHRSHALSLSYCVPACYTGPSPLLVPAAQVVAREPEINPSDNRTASRRGPAVLDAPAPGACPTPDEIPALTFPGMAVLALLLAAGALLRLRLNPPPV
jgi:hypothetical protein